MALFRSTSCRLLNSFNQSFGITVFRGNINMAAEELETAELDWRFDNTSRLINLFETFLSLYDVSKIEGSQKSWHERQSSGRDCSKTRNSTSELRRAFVQVASYFSCLFPGTWLWGPLPGEAPRRTWHPYAGNFCSLKCPRVWVLPTKCSMFQIMFYFLTILASKFCGEKEKKTFQCAIAMVHAVQLCRHVAYRPISGEIRTVDSQSDLRVLLLLWFYLVIVTRLRFGVVQVGL